jgi:hypothetical protein
MPDFPRTALRGAGEGQGEGVVLGPSNRCVIHRRGVNITTEPQSLALTLSRSAGEGTPSLARRDFEYKLPTCTSCRIQTELVRSVSKTNF